MKARKNVPKPNSDANAEDSEMRTRRRINERDNTLFLVMETPPGY